MANIIYFSPNSEIEYEDVAMLSDYELVRLAETNDEVFIFSLDEFVCQFNHGFISDEGFIKKI